MFFSYRPRFETPVGILHSFIFVVMLLCVWLAAPKLSAQSAPNSGGSSSTPKEQATGHSPKDQATEHSPIVRSVTVTVVSRAYKPALRAVLSEWLEAEALQVTLRHQPALSLNEVLQPNEEAQFRVWLTLPDRKTAKIYVANASSNRFLTREIKLARGLDEIGREQLAQVVVATVATLTQESVDEDRGGFVDSWRETVPSLPGEPEKFSLSDKTVVGPALRPPTPQFFAGVEGSLGVSFLSSWRGQERDVHSPRAELALLLTQTSYPLELQLAAGLELPRRLDTSRLRFEQTGFTFQAALASRKVLLPPRWFGGIAVGGGLESVTTKAASRVARVDALPATLQLRPLLLSQLEFGWRGELLDAYLTLGGQLLLTDAHYDVLRLGNLERELSSSRFRIALGAGVRWRFGDEQPARE